MKIAVIGAKGLPPQQGGIEHHCSGVYPRMVAQGHDVDLFGRSSYTDLPAFHEHPFEGVRTISMPSLGMRGMDAFVSSAIGAVMSSKTHYDIVHFPALGPSLFTWLPKLANHQAKVVVTCHGLDWQREKWGKLSSRVIRLGEQAAAKYADGLVVVSDDLRQYFKNTYNRDALYIPNAPGTYAESDPSFSFGKSLGLTQGKYMVYLGRLVPEKCPDLLINAFKQLQNTGWKLVFVGGTSDTNGFTAKLKALAADCPDVVFAGELRGGRLAEIVRGAGLFTLPSNLEGLPLAMLEGMQEGVPVVASDIPPHQQLIGQDRGVMFQAGDVDSCTAALNWAIDHPIEMRILGDRAQQHVKRHYTWDQITRDNLNLYKSLLGSAIRPSIAVTAR
jgi:glycosyltransferase involved in cell wall biosynthesis